MLAPGLLESVDAEEDRDPAVADLGRHLDRFAADRADEDRDLVADRVEVELQRLALATRQRQLVVLALVVDRALAGDDLAHDFDVLAGAAPGLRVRHAVPALGDLRARRAEAEEEAAAGEFVDRGAGHRGGGGRAGGHLHDRGAEFDRRRSAPASQASTLTHVGAVGLGHPDRLVAGCLGGLDHLEGVVSRGADAPVTKVESKLQRHPSRTLLNRRHGDGHDETQSRDFRALRRRSACASSGRRRRTPRARPRASSPATSSPSSTRSSASSSSSILGARPLRRLDLRPDRRRQLLHRHPPGAEGEGDPRRARGPGRPPRQGRARRRRRSSCSPTKSSPATWSSSARATSWSPTARRSPVARHDARRVDADRRGRRRPQGRRGPGAVGLLLHLRLRPLRGRRGARGQLRGQARRRGADLPPPALAAAGRGQPGDRRLHLRDGAAGGAADPRP